MPWYTLQTSPNYEAKVMRETAAKISEKGLAIEELFSPEETIVEFKEGKKKERQKRLYTNYIFVKMEYSDEIWHALRGIRGVVGFIGKKGSPAIVPEKEIAIMKARVAGEAPKPKIVYEPGVKIRIITGSFADFYGTIKESDYEKNKAKVLINIFNRETEVDIEMSAIEIAKD